MKFNKKQKTTLYIAFFVILAAILIWIGFGGEIFTKTQVLVEKKDDLLGTTYQEWKDQFVLGLDYTLGFTAIVSALAGIGIYTSRKKIT